ncbi:hypothetical protein KUTeg_015910 [Tegillarca granosa]|uniref:Uncharacterized protein n=1 Tax=Tegillarca granosa TaxID=220873 RepID=A0ABQ9EP71_TEGGR|nr:hypothetical protein KUTeg_015910 [Tegillarca granosa]
MQDNKKTRKSVKKKSYYIMHQQSCLNNTELLYLIYLNTFIYCICNLSEIYPFICLIYIQDVFGMKVSIKIDWRSVESQKRTSGSDLILRLLSNEMGNSLAGLEGVLRHCEEMKNDITYMFNHQTAKLAIQPISSIKELVIKYVDTLPDLETVFQRKFTAEQKTGFWHFSIERSTLKYDRTTFKFWHYIHLYHGTCISVLDAVKRIASTNTKPNLKKKNAKRTNKTKLTKMKPITLEIDWNSFGTHDPYVVHKLITQDVAREVLAIAHHCEAMFHLQLSGDHVIIQNTTSSKYTGVTPIFKLLTVNVYAHLMKSKKWEVSIENTFTKLCELEDKELSSKLTPSFWPTITKKLHKLQESILFETGIQVRIFIDEKRFLNLMFTKCRRDMVHPTTLIYKTIDKLFDRLPCLYKNVLDNILQSPSSTFCIVVSSFDVPSAVWIDLNNSSRTRHKNNKLLVLSKRA